MQKHYPINNRTKQVKLIKIDPDLDGTTIKVKLNMIDRLINLCKMRKKKSFDDSEDDILKLISNLNKYCTSRSSKTLWLPRDEMMNAF